MANARPNVPATAVTFGCAGMGGYAGHICDLLLTESLRPNPPVRFAAVCDPHPEDHAELLDRLCKANVKVFKGYPELLNQSLDAVWLPLPIHLHRWATELALDAGSAVMCEKPVAGAVDDHDAITAARDRTRLPVAVGYQDIYDPCIFELKQTLLSGAIGTVRQIVLRGTWPRATSYFRRNDWAGKLRGNGSWVLDSPANNAMSHFLNLALFLAGSSSRQSADPRAVDAELYRVNDIENFDTCALRIQTREGPTLLVLLTHACRVNFGPVIEFRGTEGVAEYTAYRGFTVFRGGKDSSVAAHANVRAVMLDRFCRWTRGTLGDDLVATLETSRTPLVVVNGASEASRVIDVDVEYIGMDPTFESGPLRFIKGIEQAFEICGQRFLLPSETGACPWASAFGSRDLTNYHHFAGPRF